MKYASIIPLILLLTALTSGQVQPSRSQQLSESVATLYQNGKYDEAVPIAEEIVSLERKGASTKNLGNALENLAQIKVARFKRALAELNSGSVSPAAIKNAVAKLHSDAQESESHLREALKITDAASDHKEQRIAMYNSLAWLLYNYQPPDPEVSIAFDKIGRDKFEMRTRARLFKRVGEAENLYKEALNTGAGENSLLLTTYNFAEFAMATGDLENALARFEKCIADVERIYGKKSQSLVQPLESYIKALAATGQDDLAFEMVSRLVRVTGKSAAMPKTLLNVSLRADKVFAPINSSGVESNAKANKERITLLGRRATLNASLDAMLAVSTHGKEYYDALGPARIAKVPVRVLVDETGKVVEAEALTDEKEQKRDAEAAVSAWKFRPFVAAGQSRKIKGYVECIIFADRLD